MDITAEIKTGFCQFIFGGVKFDLFYRANRNLAPPFTELLHHGRILLDPVGRDPHGKPAP